MVKLCFGCDTVLIGNGYHGFCSRFCAEESERYFGSKVYHRMQRESRNTKRNSLAVGYRTQRVTRQSRVKWA